MAAVNYPTNIPGPTQLTSEPKVRARNSGLPGVESYTAPERDYYGTVSVNFFFDRNQAAVFKAWWDTNKGYWFNALWPRLSHSLSVYRILGVPTFTHVYDGAYRVSARLELRGASLEVSVPDFCDPNWAYRALLAVFETGTLSSQNPPVFSNVGNTLFIEGNPGFGGTSDEDFKYGARSAKVVGNSSRLKVNKPSGWVGQPNFIPRMQDFCIEVWAKYPLGAAGGDMITFPTSTLPAAYARLYFVNSAGDFFVQQGAAVAATGVGVPVNQWFHLAWARGSGVSRIFINGVAKAQWNDSHDYNTDELEVRVPSNSINPSTSIHHFDELRVSIGIPEYTADFTPPGPFFTVGCA